MGEKEVEIGSEGESEDFGEGVASVPPVLKKGGGERKED